MSIQHQQYTQTKFSQLKETLAMSDKVTHPPVNAWSCSWNVEPTEKRGLVQQQTECCHKRDGEWRRMGRCWTVQLVDHQEPLCQGNPPMRPPRGQEQKYVPPERLIESVLTSNSNTQSAMKVYEGMDRSRNLCHLKDWSSHSWCLMLSQPWKSMRS